MKYLFIILLFAIYSCSDNSQKSASQTTISSGDTSNKDRNQLNLAYKKPINVVDSTVANEPIKKASISEKSYKYIAKCAIASIMGKDPENLKCKKENNLYVVSYTRDGTLYQYKIKFQEGSNNIMWGNLDGRWRNNSFDEQIFFDDKGDKLNIIQKFSDGSESIDEYSNQ